MDLNQPDEAAPGMPESRTGAFGTGQTEGKLNADGVKFMAKVPRGITQTSVLQNPFRSANGMAPADAERMLPGMSSPMASPNGSSAGSYQQALYMRLRGQVLA